MNGIRRDQTLGGQIYIVSSLAIASINETKVSVIDYWNLLLRSSPIYLEQDLCRLTTLEMTKNVSRIMLSVSGSNERTLIAGSFKSTIDFVTVRYVITCWFKPSIIGPVRPLAVSVFLGSNVTTSAIHRLLHRSRFWNKAR